LDSDGNIEWEKAYGGNSTDLVYPVQQTSDGGYIAAGFSDSFGACPCTWLLKLDSDGNIEWDKAYGEAYIGARETAIEQASDGGYLVAATTEFGAGNGDAWLLKLDSDGNIEWEKSFGGTEYEVAYSVQQTSDGG